MEEEVDAIILPRMEDLVFWLLLLVLVIVWLSCDLLKASKIGTPWILGDALMLSAIIAIIIQSLSFIDYSHVRVYSGSRYHTKEVVAILVKNQLVIDSGRVMMCVLIAYLLPGMARSGSIMDGISLGALALSIISDVGSELWSIWKVEKRNDSSSALAASLFAIFLIMAIIYLLVLLFMAIRSGEKSCRIRSQKVPSALLCYDSPSDDDIKDHVLRCWLAARLYQPDYVLVRTGLCSKAFTVVTVCIGVHVIKQEYLQFTDNESLNSVTKSTLVHFVIFGQCVIVLIGWIVLLVRLATYAYYSLSWRCLEKLCNFFAPPADGRPTDVVPDFQYEFDRLVLPGDNARSLWNANRSGFMNVKSSMEQVGNPSPSQLTNLLRRFETETAEREAARQKAEQLRPANGNSWMRTAVSLIHFMIYSYDGSDAFASLIDDAMQCYLQAWEYMNFVDGLKEEVRSLGLKANEEFNTLQHRWKNNEQRGMIKELLNAVIQRWKDRKLQNSWDSTEVTEYCLFKTEKVIGGIKEIDPLRRVLASVYYSYMTQGLKKAVVQKCWELAKEDMEEEIVAVAILSAKAQGVLQQAGRRTRSPHGGGPPGQASTGSHSPTAGGGDGGPTAQASTRSHSPTFGDHSGKLTKIVVVPNNTGQASTSSDSPTDAGEDDSTDDSLFLENPLALRRHVSLYHMSTGKVGDNSGNIGDNSGNIGNNNLLNLLYAASGNRNEIRLRRPKDSLTDQTELAVDAGEDDSTDSDTEDDSTDPDKEKTL